MNKRKVVKYFNKNFRIGTEFTPLSGSGTTMVIRSAAFIGRDGEVYAFCSAEDRPERRHWIGVPAMGIVVAFINAAKEVDATTTEA